MMLDHLTPDERPLAVIMLATAAVALLVTGGVMLVQTAT